MRRILTPPLPMQLSGPPYRRATCCIDTPKTDPAPQSLGFRRVLLAESKHKRWRGRRSSPGYIRKNLQNSALRNKKGQHHRCAGRGRICCRNRYLVQLWLTIFKLVTRSSTSSSFPAAFSTCPSFFSSAFASRVGEPVTVTWCPTWSASLTALRKSQL